MLPENTSDPSQLSLIDVEAFLVALISNVDSSVINILPNCQQVIQKADQIAFWRAAVMLHNNESMKEMVKIKKKRTALVA